MKPELNSTAGLREQVKHAKPIDYDKFTIKMLEDFMKQITITPQKHSWFISGKNIKIHWPELWSNDLELDRNYLIRF